MTTTLTTGCGGGGGGGGMVCSGGGFLSGRGVSGSAGFDRLFLALLGFGANLLDNNVLNVNSKKAILARVNFNELFFKI